MREISQDCDIWDFGWMNKCIFPSFSALKRTSFKSKIEPLERSPQSGWKPWCCHHLRSGYKKTEKQPRQWWERNHESLSWWVPRKLIFSRWLFQDNDQWWQTKNLKKRLENGHQTWHWALPQQFHLRNNRSLSGRHREWTFLENE